MNDYLDEFQHRILQPFFRKRYKNLHKFRQLDNESFNDYNIIQYIRISYMYTHRVLYENLKHVFFSGNLIFAHANLKFLLRSRSYVCVQTNSNVNSNVYSQMSTTI